MVLAIKNVIVNYVAIVMSQQNMKIRSREIKDKFNVVIGNGNYTVIMDDFCEFKNNEIISGVGRSRLRYVKCF